MRVRGRSCLSILGSPILRSLLWIAAGSLCLPAGAQAVPASEWTWVGGSSTVASTGALAGVYGTLGVPSASNIPGGRVDSVQWTDKSGNLWLFGGFAPTTSQLTYLNDLWKFNPSTKEWTWIGGSSAPACGSNGCGQSGSYGTLGQMDTDNYPGGRDSAAGWVDTSGNFWLYGGEGFDSIGQIGTLNDLWEYSPSTNQWAWIDGSANVPGNDYGDPGVYGVLGTPAPENNPGALFLADRWVDPGGNAWLFGGWGNDANGANGLPNNLWQFDAAFEQWAWMGGNNTFGQSNSWIQASVYGVMGTPAAGNTPGSRWDSATWTDSKGNLWLFGGDGYDAGSNQGYLDETWEFDLSTKQWAWMGGDSTMYCPPNADKQNCGVVGVYGALGASAPGNIPGGRTTMASWTDKAGNFWLFGGLGYDASGYNILNDLWEFSLSTNEWTWMGGDPRSGTGVYGSVGVPAAANWPGARQGEAFWTGADGDFWLFAGNAIDANGVIGLPNDLWHYAPHAASAPPADFMLAISPAAMVVAAGKTATALVTVTPENGFASAVSFSCLGLPSDATCTFAPQTVTPSGSAVSSTLSITAAAQTATLRHGRGPVLSESILAAGLLFLGFRRRRPLQMVFLFVLLLICGFASMGALSGCGNSSYLGQTPPASPLVSTVTVTATAGALQHSAMLSLTVN